MLRHSVGTSWYQSWCAAGRQKGSEVLDATPGIEPGYADLRMPLSSICQSLELAALDGIVAKKGRRARRRRYVFVSHDGRRSWPARSITSGSRLSCRAEDQFKTWLSVLVRRFDPYADRAVTTKVTCWRRDRAASFAFELGEAAFQTSATRKILMGLTTPQRQQCAFIHLPDRTWIAPDQHS
jgi:hypothetical protein